MEFSLINTYLTSMICPKLCPTAPIMLIPIILKSKGNFINISISTKARRVPPNESNVVGLNSIPESNPPNNVLAIATIKAERILPVNIKAKITTLERPSFINGNGLGTKLSSA